MNYLLKSKPRSNPARKVVIVVSVFLFITFLGLALPNVLRRIGYGVAEPFWITSGAITRGVSTIKNYFYFKNDLIKKNIALEDELNSLRIKELDYDILSREYQDLKNEVMRMGDSSRVLAKVSSRPPRSPYDTLVIDIGSSKGVGLGSKVYLGDNIIIGLITNITPENSLVSLFSTSNQNQETIVLRTGAAFTLTGRGGANFEVEVPKDADVQWGDMFMYPGSQSSLVASVYYIDTSSQSSFKKVYLRVPLNVFSSKYVSVE